MSPFVTDFIHPHSISSLGPDRQKTGWPGRWIYRRNHALQPPRPSFFCCLLPVQRPWAVETGRAPDRGEQDCPGKYSGLYPPFASCTWPFIYPNCPEIVATKPKTRYRHSALASPCRSPEPARASRRHRGMRPVLWTRETIASMAQPGSTISRRGILPGSP